MQGTEAPASIRAALDHIRPRRRSFDAVIIIRGGGGKTDLLAFDDYGLAAAVGAFPLPVITGIGHDRDEAVVDLTAHTALKTPTAVAIFFLERLARLDAAFDGYAERIQELALDQVQVAAEQLRRLARYTQQAAQTQFTQQRSLLHQRIRLAATVPRGQLRQQYRSLNRTRHVAQRAAQRALAGQQRQLRTFGRALAQRFRRHQQRRQMQLLRQRYQLQLAAERLLHRAELRLAHLQAMPQRDALGGILAGSLPALPPEVHP
jgi:exodeoxyribonuclease VII large subunit